MTSIISSNDETAQLKEKIAQMQETVNALKDELNSYPTAEQAAKINNYMAYYNNAINTAQKAIQDIEKSRANQLSGSGISEQAMKGYVQGFGSHRGATAAETLKSVADIAAQGAAARANINANADASLANAYSNLSTAQQNAGAALYTGNVATQQQAYSSTRSSKSNGEDAIRKYLEQMYRTSEDDEKKNKMYEELKKILQDSYGSTYDDYKNISRGLSDAEKVEGGTGTNDYIAMKNQFDELNNYIDNVFNDEVDGKKLKELGLTAEGFKSYLMK